MHRSLGEGRGRAVSKAAKNAAGSKFNFSTDPISSLQLSKAHESRLRGDNAPHRGRRSALDMENDRAPQPARAWTMAEPFAGNIRSPR